MKTPNYVCESGRFSRLNNFEQLTSGHTIFLPEDARRDFFREENTRKLEQTVSSFETKNIRSVQIIIVEIWRIKSE